MDRKPVEEARLVETDAGRTTEGEGWFVVNLRVLGPGRPAAFYHAESGQEAFLVLRGECMPIIEDQERPLRQWDFVHCPPHTAHVIVGAGDTPCIVLMVGARNAGREVIYPASEVAARYNAGSARETTDPPEAYATLESPPRPGRFRWPPA